MKCVFFFENQFLHNNRRIDLSDSKCPDGQAAYLPAAERKVQGTLREWGVLACSWQHRKLPPERQSPGRGPRQSAAPTATPRNCNKRCRQKTYKAICYVYVTELSISPTSEQTQPADEGPEMLLRALVTEPHPKDFYFLIFSLLLIRKLGNDVTYSMQS